VGGNALAVGCDFFVRTLFHTIRVLDPLSRDGAGEVRAQCCVVSEMLLRFFEPRKTRNTQKKIVGLRFVWDGEIPPEPKNEVCGLA
jgi:hypothetical protein